MNLQHARQIYKKGFKIGGSEEGWLEYHEARDALIEAGELPPLRSESSQQEGDQSSPHESSE